MFVAGASVPPCGPLELKDGEGFAATRDLSHVTSMAKAVSECAERYAFYLAYEQMCAYCRRPLTFNDFDIDHVIPQSAGSDPEKWQEVKRTYGLAEGFDLQDDANRMAACRPCNRDKSDGYYPPGRTAILHATAARKAPLVRELRAKNISMLVTQRAIARLMMAGTQQELDRNDVLKLLDLTGPQPDDVDNAVATPWPNDKARTLFDEVLGTASAALLAWPQEIGGQWLSRPELTEIRAALGNGDTRLTALLGPPGGGKSALLARVGTELRASGHTVLALKADALPVSVSSLASIDQWLRVPEPLPILLDRIAASAPVTLLIDQLDALSDLMDLRSERLAALLALIHRVLATPGIHVIVSCREFDAEYDLRLSNLINSARCATIRLADLPWEAVEEFLRPRGYTCTSWPDSVKQILCRPHRLKLFVRYFSPASVQPDFTSYQAMLEQVLDEAVVKPFGTAPIRALETLAEAVAQTEELWLPRTRLESAFLEQLPRLQTAGLVKLSPDNLRVGFEHQTLFEFIRARSFVAGSRTLLEEAIARQDGLAVRPVLWGAINYLRNADRIRYYAETGALLQDSAVRLHIKILVLEFLGTVSDPSRQEAEWLKRSLPAAKLRPHVMRAIERKPFWWALMKNALLECCNLGVMAAYHASWVIGPALTYDKAFILPSIEAQWLPRTELDVATYNLFRDFTEWDKSTCAIVETVVGRTPPDEVWVSTTAQAIAKKYPEGAVRLIRRKLDADLQRARQECSPPPAPLPPEASEAEKLRHVFSDRSLEPLEKLVRVRTDWYGIDNVARAAPRLFVEGLWTWVEAVTLDLTARRDVGPDRYVTDNAWYFGGNIMGHLGEALWIAVQQFASDEPVAFIAWAKQAAQSELMSVHRLTVKGLQAIGGRYPEAALEYFLGDPRRFSIVDSSTEENVPDLVETIGAALSPSDASSLISAIERCECISLADAKEEFRDEIVEINHRARFRLLARLPRAVLSDEIRQELENWSTPPAPPITDYGLVTTKRIMCDEMEKMTDAELLAAIEPFADAREFNYADPSGGTGHIVLQIEELAAKDPARMFRIVPLLKPGLQEQIAAAAISGVGKVKEIPVSQILDLVHALVERGFESELFRNRVCGLMVNLAGRTKGLPDRSIDFLIEMARSLAALPPAGKQEDEVLFVPPAMDSPKKQQKESVLWTRRGGMLPHGSFPPLQAIMLGLLRREPPDFTRWIGIMRSQLAIPDDPRVWQALLYYLGFLGGADRASANDVVRRIAETYPAILPTVEGARFVASSHVWLIQPLFDTLIDAIENSDWESAGLATGEILLLRAALVPEDERAQRRIEAALDKLAQSPGEFERGVVRSASNSWANPRFRPISHRVLMAAVSSSDPEIIDAIMDAFSGTEGDRIPADARTRELLHAIAQAPARFVSSSRAHSFIERLKELLQDSFCPAVIARAARAVLEVAGERMADMGSSFYSSSEELMEVAITLQRFADSRADGTWIFEQLIAVNAFKIDEAVRSLDRRLQ